MVATLGLAGDTLAVGRATATEARGVAVEFFRSQNERRYDDTCRLLSNGFIRSHRLRDRRTCSAVLRVNSVWNLQIEFRIGSVALDGARVVVQAVVDGVPGRLVMVREGGNLRILAVEGP
jgi:hypothetical protein